jgi:hypothetical protein
VLIDVTAGPGPPLSLPLPASLSFSFAVKRVLAAVRFRRIAPQIPSGKLIRIMVQASILVCQLQLIQLFSLPQQLLLSKQSPTQTTSSGATTPLSHTDKEAINSVGFFSNIKAISNQLSEKYRDKGKEKGKEKE